MAAHASTRTTQLYDRREDRVTLDEVVKDKYLWLSRAPVDLLIGGEIAVAPRFDGAELLVCVIVQQIARIEVRV